MKNINKVLALSLAFSIALSTAACNSGAAPAPSEPALSSSSQISSSQQEGASSQESSDGQQPAASEGDWKPYDADGKIKRTDRDGNGANGVVSTGKYEASKIGADIIAKGGNAIDAAVAVGFALGVCEPQSSGIGGGGFMMIRSAKTGEATFIDFREIAPAGASPDMWPTDADNNVTDDSKYRGGKSIGVPGEVKGLLYALDNYGTMSRADVMDPAIQMAEQGFEVSAVMNRDMKNKFDVLTEYENAGKIYLKDGFPYEVGDTLKNPDLAKTLTAIKEQGESAFYTGPIAEAIVKAAQESGGPLTMEDLTNYDIKVRKPSVGNYRGYEIISAPPPSSGGTTIVEILNILENFDVGTMDMDSAEYYHAFSEAFKIAFADRAKYIGDTDFVDVPLEGLTSKEYAKEMAAKIDMAKATNQEAGDPWAYESPQTTHYSIMDKEGNIVAVTKTVNYVFGSGVVPEGTGIILNDEMDDFDAGTEGVNTVEPNKKPLSSMSPTIVLKDGAPVMAIGAPGSQRIITGVAQVISKVIDHQMDIQDAISAPRIHDGSDYDNGVNTMIYETRIPAETVKALEEMGHKMVEEGEWMEYPCVQAVVMLEDGTLRGGADPRRDGKAIGY